MGISASQLSPDHGNIIVASALFLGIMVSAPLGGGHLNNAVTLGFYFSDKKADFDK